MTQAEAGEQRNVDALVESLKENTRRLVELEELAHVGTWEWDAVSGAVTWSDEMCRIFDMKPGAVATSADAFDLYLDRLHADDRPAARINVERALRENLPYAADYRVRCGDGEQRWVHCRGRAILDASGRVVRLLGVAQDITDRKELEERLAHQALHDPLTGLPNRSLLLDRLTHAMQRTLRSQRHTAVFFIDLDRFKGVNDGAGHDAGDEVLRAVAARLSAAVRQHDTVARYGGDEFVVIAEEIEWPRQAVEVGTRLLETVARPVPHRTGELLVTASIGATLTTTQSDAKSVVRDADTAMYRAKHRGGHAVVWVQDA